MGARLKAFVTSLAVRLLIPLLLVVGGVLAVHAFVSFRSTQERLLDLVAGEADRSSALIRRATHDGMLLNRLDEVQATIERLAEGPEVSVIRVYDKEGAIVLSSGPAELGRRVPLEEPPCSECHAGGTLRAPAATEATDVIHAGEQEVVRNLTLIENEPACSSAACHADDRGEAVLGVLDVEMSMAPVEAALASARRNLFTTTVVMMVIISLVAVLMFRQLVGRPIRELQVGTRRVAEGDLDTRIQVSGDHELASLARDFNRMAADLDTSRRQVTDWSQRLEEKVVEKTAEARDAQRQVLHMEKMASLGKLSATVAHELNNPLSGVLTYAKLVERELADEPLTEEGREEVERHLHLIQQESARCGDIVRNLLIFARRTGTEPVETDLDDVVRRSLMLVQHHMEMRGVELEARLLGGEGHIVADRSQLQQALVALLMNAVEAMPEGGELRVALAWVEGGVEIEVSDTGTGIPEEVLPQIFEPFFSTKEDEAGGMGLGLAVVYGIVHRHGGSIRVDSEEGRGTTFRIRLPRRPPVSDAEGADEARSARGGGLRPVTAEAPGGAHG